MQHVFIAVILLCIPYMSVCTSSSQSVNLIHNVKHVMLLFTLMITHIHQRSYTILFKPFYSRGRRGCKSNVFWKWKLIIIGHQGKLTKLIFFRGRLHPAPYTPLFAGPICIVCIYVWIKANTVCFSNHFYSNILMQKLYTEHCKKKLLSYKFNW